jgi:hypothetical protein
VLSSRPINRLPFPWLIILLLLLVLVLPLGSLPLLDISKFDLGFASCALLPAAADSTGLSTRSRQNALPLLLAAYSTAGTNAPSEFFK